MLDQLQNTYSGKKIFITGHTGFKGSWLLKLLHLLGANVKGYALAPKTANDLFYLIDGDHICESQIADLRDKESLTDSLVSFQPDFVFHLAAQPLVRLSYEIPAETFEVNVIGTANVLDAVRQLEKQCQVILITTDKVYHNNEWIYPYRETDRLGGFDPYSASKACTELLISSYRNSFFHPSTYVNHMKSISVGRAGNVIGGGDWSKDRLLPDIAKALGNNDTIIVRNPSSIRPWQHVLEPLAGYLELGVRVLQEPNKYSEAFNFGPVASDALSVESMVKLAIESWGSGQYKNELRKDQPHEAGLLQLDISKALTETNWKPRFDAKKAVVATVEWYKTFFTNRNSISEFTEKQINDFIKYE